MYKILLIALIVCIVVLTPQFALAALDPPTSVTASFDGPNIIRVSMPTGANSGDDVFRGYKVVRVLDNVATVLNYNTTTTTTTTNSTAYKVTFLYKVYSIYNHGRISTPTNATVITGVNTSSACNGDCDAPTLGINKNNLRLVNDGFSYNGNPIDVGLFYTPYPLITTNVGTQNRAVFKIFEDGGQGDIKHLDLAFGLAAGQTLGQSKARIEWDKTYDGTESVKLIDPENVLQEVKVVTSNTNCLDTESAQNCLEFTIFHTFRAPLDFNIVATNVWDENRNSWQNYYNHGIEVMGESLDGPKQYTGIHRGKILTLFETDRNTAMDEDGNAWIFDGEWIKVYVSKGKIVDDVSPWHGYDRNHAYWNAYKDDQVLLAEQYLTNVLNVRVSH